jgi:hypothetical protein
VYKTQELKGVNTISENCTKSDEAFLLLLLDNSWETWTAYASKNQEMEASTEKQQDENMEQLVPVPKCTVGVYSHGRNPGWSEEGKEEFVKLYDMVAKN